MLTDSEEFTMFTFLFCWIIYSELIQVRLHWIIYSKLIQVRTSPHGRSSWGYCRYFTGENTTSSFIALKENENRKTTRLERQLDEKDN